MIKKTTTRRSDSLTKAFEHNFLGRSPGWYKKLIILFLILNPLIYVTIGSFTAGWLLVAEFIFTLAMALRCYPLQPGGLLTLEAIAIGMASPEQVYEEVLSNFPVILLLIFMVAGIYFMKDMLLYVFTKILLGVRSKIILSLLFSFTAAVLSAFLDALTVAAILISVAIGFYSVYHKAASGKAAHHEHDHCDDCSIRDGHKADLRQFRAFLRSLLMHGAVGTALGGACTLVGEPQNLLIGKAADWEFQDFFINMAPVSMPVLVAGLITCVILEKTRLVGYGATLPPAVRCILEDYVEQEDRKRTLRQKARFVTQAVVFAVLILALSLQAAEVGLVGLMVIILLTALNGLTDEHQLGPAFHEALPFTTLLVVFFAIVAVIHEQELFNSIIDWVLEMDESNQPGMFFLANGALSIVSDNVFVATIYISEVEAQLNAGAITRDHFDRLAIAINTGTNIPSVATPNGQAAFLFLLTSSLAPLIRLSYGRMLLLALPYTIALSLVGFLAVWFWI